MSRLASEEGHASVSLYISDAASSKAASPYLQPRRSLKLQDFTALVTEDYFQSGLPNLAEKPLHEPHR